MIEENTKRDKKESKGVNRRKVLIGLGSMSLLSVTGLCSYVSGLNSMFKKSETLSKEELDPVDKKLKLGLIGFGIRGEQLMRSAGYATPKWIENVKKQTIKNKNDRRYQDFLNQPSLNVEFMGICDIFDLRAKEGLKALGKRAKRYKSYKDLIHSKDIDAVIIATPDHLHASMIIEAAKSGKHVYVEKCLTRTIEETYAVYKAVKNSNVAFQLGHQLRHNGSYHAAKDVIDKGLLGKISLIQTNSNRNSPNGAWIYDIHPKANSKTVDWKQFDINNSRTQFNADRFIRWRKYWDYGTGICGDLMTHDFDAINQILEMGIPEKVTASGGNYHWKDGREVPDVLQVTMEYPSKGYTYLYSATQSNGHLRPNLIMGDDGTMEIGAKMHVYPDPNSKRYKDKVLKGSMDPTIPFYSSEQPDDVDAVSSATTKYFANKGMMYTYRNGKRLDPTYLHIEEWLNGIRHRSKTSCNIEQAFQEGITVHMAVKSYKEQRQVRWDRKTKKII